MTWGDARYMSFRGRLTIFFLAIVVVPMIAVAALVVRISDDSQAGKADARLAAGLNAAQVIYDRALEGAPAEVARIARTPGVEKALKGRSAGFLKGIARDEALDPNIAAVAFFDGEGELLARAGAREGLAASRRGVASGAGKVGEIEVAALTASDYVDEVAELTGERAAVVDDRGPLAASMGAAGLEPGGGEPETFSSGDGELRVASIGLDGAPPGARLVLATDAEQGFVASEPLVALVLLAFFCLALIFIVLLMRMLQRQVASMLEAAESIGSGDFTREVPVEGNDEMAGLAREFNKMSGRLSAQMDQLRRQRTELEQSVQRIGEALAAGLDRTALLEIVVETAIASCEAEAGQLTLDGAEQTEVLSGETADPELADALESAGIAARRSEGVEEVTTSGAHAIAHRLVRAGEPSAVLGTMAVARKDGPFDSAEREVLRYLIGQAAISVENIGLHERVAEQAVTDELTGLSNKRYFREWMERETLRLSRFGGWLSLVILDVDDFKAVNDTYGHLQGDAVLETIGQVLRMESRGIDEPARYGGEEFVLALPETSREGAAEVAERVRARIEATEVEGVDGNPPLQVTASVGVATMPADAAAVQSLIAAADEALYEAKRAGKNRVVAAREL